MSNTAKTIFGTLLGIMVLGVAFRAYDSWRWNQPVDAPAAAVADDTEVEPTTNWTTAKQVVYDGCIKAATFDGAASYCYCASDYAIDTYGISQVNDWGDDIPQRVIDEVLERCL